MESAFRKEIEQFQNELANDRFIIERNQERLENDSWLDKQIRFWVESTRFLISELEIWDKLDNHEKGAQTCIKAQKALDHLYELLRELD